MSLCIVGCSGAAAQPQTFPSRAATHESATSPEALPRLRASVEELSDAPAQIDQHKLGKTLEDLAAALEPVSKAGALRLGKIAQTLNTSPADLLTHPGLLKQALDITLQALAAAHGIPSERRASYQRAVQTSSSANDAVQQLVPLSEQAEPIATALRAATDAVFLAQGGEPPFGEADTTDVPAAPLGSFKSEIEQASHDVGALSQAKWMHARVGSARVLSSLAAVIAAADRGGKLKARIDEIRFEAERLEKGDPLNFGQAGWIKTGLTNALDAWEALGYGAATAAPGWLRNARRAVANLSDKEPLTFQRGALQEACRSTVDAFAAAQDLHAP